MESDIWTEFQYLYRDAGNFKVFGSVILRGRLDECARAKILEVLDEDGRFVAEQVGIPSLYGPLHQLTNGPCKTDVYTHEFCDFEELPFASIPTGSIVWGCCGDFINAFASVKEWAMELSPNAQNCRMRATAG